MKILVLSDSHAGLSFMRACIRAVKPDAMIHLGDYFEDGTDMAEEFPHIPMHQVPGNCDRYRVPSFVPEILIPRIGGVDLYLTHGHTHRVKTGIGALLRDARACQCAAALYGHTHIPHCEQLEDGMWVLNPGAAGYNGGTAGLIEIQNNKIVACSIIGRRELEEIL
jgi:putative phosphoesterase